MRHVPALCVLLIAAAATLPAMAAGPHEQEGFAGAPVLVTSETVDGGAVTYPAGTPEVAAVVLTMEPGGRSDLHHHPVAAVVYVLEGVFELREGETSRIYKAGEAFIEPINAEVQAFNPGTVVTKALVVHIGSTSVESIVRDE